MMYRRRLLFPVLVFCSAAVPAHADEVATVETQVAPPQVPRAFELAFGVGYAQGFGNLGKGKGSLHDVAGPGAAAEVDLGYRLSPHLLLGGFATGSTYAQGVGATDFTNVHSVSAGIQANWHFLPGRRLDPWIGLASGWRWLWLSPDQGPGETLNGVDVARVQIGVDYHGEEVTLSPVIGADLSMFLRDAPSDMPSHNIGDPRASVFLFTGLLVRFDIGPHRASL